MDFGSTQWSRILALGGADEDRRGELLRDLADRYWPPIYAWLRRKGHPPSDAEDLTQAFFLHILEKRTLDGIAGRERGSFRAFLLTCLRNFVSSERRGRRAARRQPGRRMLSVDGLEASLAADESGREPDQEYQYQWARRVVELALAAMAERLVADGRTESFRLFEAHLQHRLTTGTALSRRELAARFGRTEKQVDNQLQTLRREFRLRLEAVVLQSVDDEGAFDEEIRELREYLDPK